MIRHFQFFEENYKFIFFSEFERIFLDLEGKNSEGLSKLHFMCPEQHFGERILKETSKFIDVLSDFEQ